VRQEVLDHIAPNSEVRRNTGLDCLSVICPRRSADYTSHLVMHKYGLVPRSEDEIFDKIPCLLFPLALLIGPVDCLVEMCISACILAQVHHEVQYRNALQAAEEMDRN
jgi:hypothetical protein